MQPIQILAFVGALIWGTVMRLGYERLTWDPETSNRQVGYAAIAFYGLLLLSLIVAFIAGEGALLGYVVGALFVGAYRSPAKR